MVLLVFRYEIFLPKILTNFKNEKVRHEKSTYTNPKIRIKSLFNGR